MFLWVVRHLRWLARVPLLPQLFDALLLGWTALFRRERVHAMDALEAGALALPGVTLHVHRLGGIEFHRAGRELGHVHGHGLLDVRLPRAEASELLAAQRVRPHHVMPRSGWVSFLLESEADVPFAVELLRRAGNALEGGAAS